MIIIFRGASGAGKTTCIRHLRDQALGPGTYDSLVGQAINAELGMLKTKMEMNGTTAGHITTFSADAYFVNDQGDYQFDPARLSQAHADCLHRFTDKLTSLYVWSPKDSKPHVLIVDNTNTSIAEVAPYAALAGAFGHELHIFTLLVDPLTAWRRQRHDTPLTNVVKMHLQLEQSIRDWPAWWPQKIFPVV